MDIDTACAYLGAVERENFLAAVGPALSPVRLPGGMIRYDRRDLDAWVDGRGLIPPKRSDADWLQDVSDA
jgi:hypothetical protein